MLAWQRNWWQLMEELGMEKREGGPKKWEAHLVHHKNGPQWKSWFIFSYPSFLNLALMPVTFTQHLPPALPPSPRLFHGPPRLCESHDNSGIQPWCRKVLTTWQTTAKLQLWMTQQRGSAIPVEWRAAKPNTCITRATTPRQQRNHDNDGTTTTTTT